MAIMRTVWNAFLLLSFLCAVLVGSPPALAATPRSLTATVERVSDGDTVVVITGNQTKLRLRLLGIDAPEIPHGRKPGQPFGQEARDYLDHPIGGKTVMGDVGSKTLYGAEGGCLVDRLVSFPDPLKRDVVRRGVAHLRNLFAKDQGSGFGDLLSAATGLQRGDLPKNMARS